MSRPQPRWQILAYDVRDPRRLRRLHYRLRPRVAWLQESVALIQLAPAALDALLEELAALLKPEDDLRLYPLDGLDQVWLAGPDPLPGSRLGSRTPERKPPARKPPR